MRFRLAGLGLVLATAFAAAGCGGGGSSTSDAAQLAPSNSIAFVSVDSDFGSSQIKSVKALLDKFPIKDKLLAQVSKSAASSGVDVNKLKSSIGSEVDAAVFNSGAKTQFVVFAKPSDEKAFDQQLDSGTGSKPVHEKVSGWTVVSSDQAGIDAVKSRKGNLSDLQQFKDAWASLPTDAIARAYVSTAALGQSIVQSFQSLLPKTLPKPSTVAQGAQWISAAVRAHDNGLGVELHVKHFGKSVAASPGTLAGLIPSGALAALSLNGPLNALGAKTLPATGLNQPLQGALGATLQQIAQALPGEAVAYVKAGSPLPEVTLLAQETNPQQAAATAGAIIQKIAGQAKPAPAVVGGVTLQKVSLGPIDILYGAWNGKLIVTDSETAVTELAASGTKLGDDEVFKSVKSAAGMPASNQGFLYLDLKDGVPTVEGFMKLANQAIPPAISQNLAPLKAFLLYGSRSNDVETLVAFLQTS